MYNPLLLLPTPTTKGEEGRGMLVSMRIPLVSASDLRWHCHDNFLYLVKNVFVKVVE